VSAAAGTPATSSVTCAQWFSDLGTCTRCRGQSFNRYQPSFLGGGHFPGVRAERCAHLKQGRSDDCPSVRFYRAQSLLFAHRSRRVHCLFFVPSTVSRRFSSDRPPPPLLRTYCFSPIVVQTRNVLGLCHSACALPTAATTGQKSSVRKLIIINSCPSSEYL